MINVRYIHGLKIGLCQQRYIPANPQQNGEKIIRAIAQAERLKIDLLVFPEGVQGYLIGDTSYESEQFLKAVDDMNEAILQATVGTAVVVAYGTLRTEWDEKGEDGRVRRKNAGYLVQNGKILKVSNKTLSPNYRMFPEARYFFDNRKIAEEVSLATNRPMMDVLRELLRPINVTFRNGVTLKIGQEFCEDMWDGDYAIKPTRILAEDGADIIVNHSASPWTWRKNNKRHRVVKDLMQGIPAEIRPKLFIYVNRVGVEQSNKNFYVYDGSSAVYDGDGDLVCEMPPYKTGTKVFTFKAGQRKLEEHTADDTQALYQAQATVIDHFYGSIPDEQRFVYVGLSGGIDSAVMAALLVSCPCLGRDRVIGVNMPYGNYNSSEGKHDAEQLATNLCIKYLEIDITEIVDTIARKTGVQPGTLDHKNIQARCRMEILAALAQKEEDHRGLVKKGGRFTANGNKVEMAFGFGTMYGDIAGATMLFGDLVKREVYQLGDYLNRHAFGLPPIPVSMFERAPADELDDKRKPDPFIYGSLYGRGYHDEWVRAVTEFRWDPLRFLKEYEAGTLEKTLLLPEGHIQKWFPTAQAFIERLERDWNMFTAAYWKRLQCPPVPVFTRRAFGGDLAESMNPFDFHSKDYEELKAKLLQRVEEPVA